MTAERSVSCCEKGAENLRELPNDQNADPGWRHIRLDIRTPPAGDDVYSPAGSFYARVRYCPFCGFAFRNAAQAPTSREQDTCGRPGCTGPARCSVPGCEALHPNACALELPDWVCPHHAKLNWRPSFGDYIVLCRSDICCCTDCREGKHKGGFELATRRSFASAAQAFEYAEGIASSREPFVALVFSPDRKKP